MLDCATCKRRVRGPWVRHASTDSHARAVRGPVHRVRAARCRRENAGVRWIGGRASFDAWSDDGRDWDQEERDNA